MKKTTTKPAAESILAEAERITSGDRHSHYGHPLDNHGCTAALWNAYLARKGHTTRLTARDVCMLNILQKVSRDANLPKRDNLVDIAGYAMNAQMAEDRQKQMDVLAELSRKPESASLWEKAKAAGAVRVVK